MVDSAANRPAPTANGTFAKTPLVHLLLYMMDKRLGGTIELLTPDKRSATIVFSGGQPAKVRTSDGGEYLGRVLSDMGLISEEQLTRSLADLAKQKAVGPKLHGELLVGQGIIDIPKLRRGLDEQITRKLRQCASLPLETAFGYYDGFDALAGWGGEVTRGIDPLGVLWSLLREYPPWDHVRPAVAKVAQSPLRLRGAEFARLGLTGAEQQAVELLRSRPLIPADLARAGVLDERVGQLLVYLLLATKQVEVLAATDAPPASPDRVSRPPTSSKMKATASTGASMAPGKDVVPSPGHTVGNTLPPNMGRAPGSTLPPTPGRPPGPSAAPNTPGTATLPPISRSTPSGSRTLPPGRISVLPVPPGLPQPLAERWKEITDRAATIDRADYFSMLEVAKDATTQEVETAYFALAKIWHPDRLPPELSPVRDPCARVFGRMSEARQTLADAALRERYMKLVAEGSGSPEMQETVARVVEASTHFQKAEVCFKRNDAAGAEEYCRRAIELDDTQPDYHALLAWLVSKKPENQTEAATREAIKVLDRAIALSEKSERAHFWRGMLYKRLGKVDIAVRDFKKAVELNPRNIDAAREVRLHTMRGGKRSSRPPGPPLRDSNPAPPKTDDKPGLLGRFFKKS